MEKVFIVIIMFVVLAAIGIALVRLAGGIIQKKQKKSIREAGMNRGRVMFGVDDRELGEETESFLSTYREENPKVKITGKENRPDALLEQLQRGQLDLLVVSTDGVREMDSRKTAVKVSFADGRMVTDICGQMIDHPSFAYRFYLFWNEEHKSRECERLISFFINDSGRTRCGYCDYEV